MTAREDLARIATNGIVGVSIIAGHIRATDQRHIKEPTT